MKTNMLKLAVFLMVCSLPLFLSGSDARQIPEGRLLTTGLGNPASLMNAYNKWESEFVTQGGDRDLIIALKWSKGLSDEFVRAGGYARINLIDGKITAEVGGFPKDQPMDIWMVENVPGPGRTVVPEPGDQMLKVGSLKHEGKFARLEANLGRDAFASFEPDILIVTREGASPADSRLLLGFDSLFHKLYRSKQRGQFGAIAGATASAPVSERPGLWDRIFGALSPTAQAQFDPPVIIDIVGQGRNIFFNETFDGNGRTCGSCHREENNLTIDPTFISTLPPSDPLFVAEFNPALAQDFEKPQLMRQVGLILENVDGFDDLRNKFTMRGVPHTLALPTSIRSNLPGFAEATGWSGDGAPTNDVFPLPDGVNHIATGSLKDFAIGAVRQHFTKTLARRPVGGIQPRDFRFPTSEELDALEAFQLSTGRQADLALPLNLRGPLAALGQNMFLVNPNNPNGLSCNTCHSNAGAIFGGAGPDNGFNANRDTNVEEFPNQPGRLIQSNLPIDGGFGSQNGPCPPLAGCGNGQFNITTVVEAADSGPFFHNNALNTVEGSVQFYNTGIPAQFNLNASQVQAIGAFMRVINALENIRSAIDLEQRALEQRTQAGAAELLRLSIEELQDAINVLSGGSLHPDAIAELRSALARDQFAINTADSTARNTAIGKALIEKEAARNIMVGP